jgi:hypothetical protein
LSKGIGAKSGLSELQFQRSGHRYTVSAYTSAFADSAFAVEVTKPDGSRSLLSCSPQPVAIERMHILQNLGLPLAVETSNADRL